MGDKRKNGTQRELILEQSNRLFWDKGYAETSMKDIANACGFRPANIYNFFECKESILFENLLQEMIEIVTPVRHLKDDEDADPIESLRFFIKNHVALTLGEKSSSKLLFDVGLKNLSEENRKKIIRLRDEYDAIGEAVIRRGVRKGVFSPVDEKIAIFSIASIIARSRIWYSPKGRYTVDDIVGFIFNFTLNGIGAGKK